MATNGKILVTGATGQPLQIPRAPGRIKLYQRIGHGFRLNLQESRAEPDVRIAERARVVCVALQPLRAGHFTKFDAAPHVDHG